MSDVHGHTDDHASDTASHGHVPVDPNDAVVRARPPTPIALILTAVAAVLTVVALVAVAVASGQGT
ncbi:hypothetical protein NE236_12185 [Actinoallomurus purpureus]|uniref:hypothetical protein n=1 Tax=Actinoallomurus purpureus TaxID=478114 RepID=UPI0020935539|nr:hypothetical protein [Actinoallomurus purpureus]MCO6005742.1 hypothetical protein [Actinoallomurus purpureus]